MKEQFHTAEELDKRRWGCELKDGVGRRARYVWVGEVLDQVDDVLQGLNIVSSTNHSHDSRLTFLLAQRGARSQMFHADFRLGGVFDRRNKPQRGEEDDYPCAPWAISVIIALSKEGAYLDLPCGQVHIKQYEAIVFAGDLRHAGSKYDKQNLRLHVYYAYEDGVYVKKVPTEGEGRKTHFSLGEDERRDPKTRGWETTASSRVEF